MLKISILQEFIRIWFWQSTGPIIGFREPTFNLKDLHRLDKIENLFTFFFIWCN